MPDKASLNKTMSRVSAAFGSVCLPAWHKGQRCHRYAILNQRLCLFRLGFSPDRTIWHIAQILRSGLFGKTASHIGRILFDIFAHFCQCCLRFRGLLCHRHRPLIQLFNARLYHAWGHNGLCHFGRSAHRTAYMTCFGQAVIRISRCKPAFKAVTFSTF